MKIIKFFITFFIGSFNLIFIGLFFIIFPLIFLYCQIRKIFKKAFHQRPAIIYAPIGIPMVFLAVKADQKAGFRTGTFCFEVATIFRSLNSGYILKEHPWALRLNYLTGYLWAFLGAIFSYDIFQYSFSGGLLSGSILRRWELPLLKILGKNIIIFAYGADSRLKSEVKKFKYNTYMDAQTKDLTYSEAEVRINIARAKKYADIIIGGADLVFFGSKMTVLPVAADLEKLRPENPRKHHRVRIIFPTNHPVLKGGRYIQRITNKIQDSHPITFYYIHNLPYEQTIKKYQEADIIIEDVISGWYGQTTVEAMALGKPVVCYLRKDIFKKHQFYAKDLPVQSASPDNLEKVLLKLIKSPRLRRRLGEQGIEFVQKYHSLENIGKMKSRIYQKLWQK